MTLVKRAFDIMPECLDKNTEKGQKFSTLLDSIHNCIKNNWAITKDNVEKLEKEGDKEGDLNPLKNAFKGFFTSYSDIIKQNKSSFSGSGHRSNVSKIDLFKEITKHLLFQT